MIRIEWRRNLSQTPMTFKLSELRSRSLNKICVTPEIVFGGKSSIGKEFCFSYRFAPLGKLLLNSAFLPEGE